MANHLNTNAASHLMTCAKKEMLEKGYEEASLRHIAGNAGVSTYLIYQRFGDKSGLFNAIVTPAKERLITAYAAEMALFNKISPTAPYEEMMRYSIKASRRVVDLIYEDLDTFRLIVNVAPVQAHYQDLVHQLMDIHIEQTNTYFKAIGSDVMTQVPTNLLHILFNSYFDGIFEMIRHDMTKDDAITFCQQILRFYMTGFQSFDVYMAGKRKEKL